MSFGPLTNRLASQKNIRSKSISETTFPWIRPADWLTLPVLTGSDKKFVGLHAIYENSNFCALTASGAYTVDWGDGVVENFASGATAQHEYSFQTYDVENSTLTSKGYKQVIVQVYPQVGQTFTALNLNVKHLKTNLQSYSSGFLDISISGINLSSISIGATTPAVRMNNLEQVVIYSHSVTNMAALFASCSVLQSVPLFNTTNVNNMFAMFYFCYALETVPLFNTENVTSMTSMFSTCASLKSVPLFNTTKVTAMTSMFSGCAALQSVPLFNTRNNDSMSNMFFGCASLETVPLFNTENVTTMNSMFSGCVSLKSVPLFNTARVTNTSGMFTNCQSLQTVPLFDTSGVLNMSNMFSGCTALQSVPPFNTRTATNITVMFNNCFSLQTVPLIDVLNATNFSSTFGTCQSLSKIDMTNINAACTINALKLSTNEINKVIQNLVGSNTNKTLTISSNHGIDIPISKTGNITSNSPVVLMSDTSNLLVGMSVTAASGMPYSSIRGMSLETNTVTSAAAHGLFENTPFCFVLDPSFLTRSTTSPILGGWQGIEYGNGTFVAFMGNSSNAVTSPDGITWTQRTLPTSTAWQSIAYGNGTFVLIGSGSSIAATSTDGITWTQRTLPTSANWQSIAYGNGTFVAIAYNSSIAATSTDGITWTQRTLPTSANWQSIAYGNGTFVAIAFNSTVAATSTDGITWTQRTTPTATSWQAIGYGNGTFVAVSATNISATSTDGITWTRRTLPATANWRKPIYADGLFVVGRAGVSQVITSPNGINWTFRSLSVSSQGDVAYGGTFFVATPSVNSSTFSALQQTVLNTLKTYYAKNVTANTFQVTETPGGAALSISIPGPYNIQIRPGSYITAINPNVSITLSASATATTSSVAFSIRPSINVMQALMKNWAITF
jgi:surface protein